MERSCSVMSQQVWRWTLPILRLRPQPPLPPPNPRHRRIGCAPLHGARRASASWDARDPAIITHDGVRQGSGGGQTTRDEPQCLLAVLVPLCLSGSSARWSLIQSLSTHKGLPNCKLVKWLPLVKWLDFGLSAYSLRNDESLSAQQEFV